MSADRMHDKKTEQKKGTKPEKFEDLKDPSVSDKHSAKVKGGLNPQPLPPKPKPPI